ncbi:MAG TPA: hypothetical protein VGD50_07535 [Candidatus Baltobacteraceae bacterium]
MRTALAGSVLMTLLLLAAHSAYAQTAPSPQSLTAANPAGGSVAFSRFPDDTTAFSGVFVYPKNNAAAGTTVLVQGGPPSITPLVLASPMPPGAVLYVLRVQFPTVLPTAQTVRFRGNLEFTLDVPATYIQTPQLFSMSPYDSSASPPWFKPIRGTPIDALFGSGRDAFQHVHFSVRLPTLSSNDTVAFVFTATPQPLTAWSGDFTGFPGQEWQSAWKVVLHTILPGYSNAQSDPALPQPGMSLHAHYDAHSSGFSCPYCGYAYGGLQFDAYAPAHLANPAAVYLRYYLKFPTGFDWGIEGKLPGLFGGTSSSCSTGSSHCPGAWSTRLEWHTGKGTGRCAGATCGGEIFLDNGCSDTQIDVGRGNWNFLADGAWHSVEEYVNTASLGTVTVWYDGKQVATTPLGCSINDPVAGLLFQTFYGGNAAKYGPDIPTDTYFGGFQTSASFI